MRAFSEAVQPSGGQVVAADVDGLAPSLQFADRHLRLPPVTSSDYADALLAGVERYRIDVLAPTIDTELFILAGLSPSLAGAAGGILCVDTQ